MNDQGSHSVRRHLRIEIDAYDAAIRRFIPGYEEMLAVAARELAPIAPDPIVDLGAGTGALAEAILASSESSVVELIDIDPEMLDQARTRLARFGRRARYTEASFMEPLPRCRGAAASLSLVVILDSKPVASTTTRARTLTSPLGEATVTVEPLAS